MNAANAINGIELTALVLSMAFLIFMPIELFNRWRRKQLNLKTIKEMLASSSPLLLTVLSAGLVTAFITLIYTQASRLAPWSMANSPVSILACLLLIDFLYYIDHRCGHRVRAYWAVSHSVHHSSPQYDQTTAFRISFVDGFISPWFYTPALLIGFDITLVIACFGFILGYQQWLHTETVGKLPWFDPWLNTPSNHRVHHGSQPQYIDKNYGAVLMIWDRLFGSYQPEEAPVVYGITHPIGSSNPILVHIWELKRLWSDLRQARSWRRRIGLMIRAPE